MRQSGLSIFIFSAMIIFHLSSGYCQTGFDKPIPKNWNYLYENFRVVRPSVANSDISRKGVQTETISWNDGQTLRFLKYDTNGVIIVDKQTNLDTTYYSYNKFGDMKYMVTESNSYDSIVNRYDEKNRLIAQYSKKYDSEMWFEYNNSGLITKIKFHKGTCDSINCSNQQIRTSEFVYDKKGHLKAVKRNYNTNNFETLTFHYTKDTIRCLISDAHGIKDTITCIYKSNLLIEKNTTISTNNSIVTDTYTYNSEEKIIKRIESSTLGNLKVYQTIYNDFGLPKERTDEIIKSILYDPRKNVFKHEYTYY